MNHFNFITIQQKVIIKFKLLFIFYEMNCVKSCTDCQFDTAIAGVKRVFDRVALWATKKYFPADFSTKINPQVQAHGAGHCRTSETVNTLTPNGIALRVRN